MHKLVQLKYRRKTILQFNRKSNIELGFRHVSSFICQMNKDNFRGHNNFPNQFNLATNVRYHLQLVHCRQITYNVHLLVGVPGASTLLRCLDEVGLGPQGGGEVEWAPPHTANTPTTSTKVRVVVK